MRSFASGLENVLHLAFDFVLRRNVRMAMQIHARSSSRPFIATTYGSHHVALTNRVNNLWNKILSIQSCRRQDDGLTSLPVLAEVDSGEFFGLATSTHASTFGGLIKEEEEDASSLQLHDDLPDATRLEILSDMNIDPILALQPAVEALPKQEVELAPETSSTRAQPLHTQPSQLHRTPHSSDSNTSVSLPETRRLNHEEQQEGQTIPEFPDYSASPLPSHTPTVAGEPSPSTRDGKQRESLPCRLPHSRIVSPPLKHTYVRVQD